MAIDWTRGYSATWRLHEVEQSTWTDGARVSGVTSASVERSCDGDAPELESSSVSLDQEVGEGFRERVLRLVMVAEQDGARERVDVCTQIFAATSGNTSMGLHSRSLKGRSVLHSAATTKTWLAYGAYVPAGSDGPTEVGKMLSASIAAPVSVEGSFTLDAPYVFTRDENVLTSAWAILKAGGWRIRIDGRGRVRVCQEPPEDAVPALTLSGDLVRLVLAGDVSDDLDWTGVPNRYTAEEGTEVVTIVNDEPTSVTSVPYRGYVVDEYDSSPVRINGESLEAYAERMLGELSTIGDSRSWEREWWPDVVPGDIVRGTMRRDGIEGVFHVTRQSLRCGTGIVVTEQAERRVSSWPL